MLIKRGRGTLALWSVRLVSSAFSLVFISSVRELRAARRWRGPVLRSSGRSRLSPAAAGGQQSVARV